MNKWSYKEKFVQMNKEAKMTWIFTAIVIIFWWIAGFGVYKICGPEWTIIGMPAWFVLSCFGSWFLSIAVMVYLVKFVCKDFDLDDEEEITSTVEIKKGEDVR